MTAVCNDHKQVSFKSFKTTISKKSVPSAYDMETFSNQNASVILTLFVVYPSHTISLPSCEADTKFL